MPIDILKAEGIDPATLREPETEREPVDILQAEGITLPSEPQAKSKLEKSLDLINSVGAGTAQNIMDLGTGAIDLAHHLTSAGHIPLLSEIAQSQPYIGKKEFRVAAEAPVPIAEKVGEFLDPLLYAAPEVKLGEGAGALASKIIPALKRTPALLRELTSKAATGAATGATYGAVLSPGQQKAGAEIGAGIGGTLGGILGAPGTIVGSTLGRIARRARAPGARLRTPEEAARIAQALIPPGAKTPIPVALGDLTKDPSQISLYHDLLGHIPLSGARLESEQVINQARSNAQDIAKNLKHKIDPVEVDKHLLEKVTQSYKTLRDISGKQYDALYQEAEDRGIKINPENLNQKAKELSKEYKHVDLQDLITNLDKKSLKRAANMAPQTDFSILRRNISVYGKKGHALAARGEPERAKIFFELKSAAKEDLENSIKGTKDEDLINNLSNANSFYKENNVPYKSSKIRDLIYKKIDPDKIQNTLLEGEHLPIVKHLDDSSKDILAYKKFAKALPKNEKETDPFKLVSLYKDLSEKQKNALFGIRTIRNKFENLKNLTEMSKEPAITETRPATGWRWLGQAAPYLMGAMGGAAAFVPHAAPELLAGMAGTMAGGRALASALSSDWLRRAYTTGRMPAALEMRRAPGILSRLLTMGITQPTRGISQ